MPVVRTESIPGNGVYPLFIVALADVIVDCFAESVTVYSVVETSKNEDKSDFKARGK